MRFTFSIGTRFNDRITGDLNEFAPKAKIVHIDVDTASISRNVVVDVPIVADANVALDKLNEWAEPKKTAEWQKQIKAWDEENPLGMRRDKGMTPQMIMEHINKNYKDAIYVTDVGQHQMWATQYLELDSNSQLLTSGGLGTMGFGLPAAIGAKIANPDKDVVCISGDGGLQMNIQELATSVVQGAGVTICVLNNYYLGMVRQMQQLFMASVILQPAFEEERAARMSARDQTRHVLHTHRIFSSLLKAMVDTESAWKGRGYRCSLCRGQEI